MSQIFPRSFLKFYGSRNPIIMINIFRFSKQISITDNSPVCLVIVWCVVAGGVLWIGWVVVLTWSKNVRLLKSTAYDEFIIQHYLRQDRFDILKNDHRIIWILCRRPYLAILCRAKFSSGKTICRAKYSSPNRKFVTFAQWTFSPNKSKSACSWSTSESEMETSRLDKFWLSS